MKRGRVFFNKLLSEDNSLTDQDYSELVDLLQEKQNDNKVKKKRKRKELRNQLFSEAYDKIDFTKVLKEGLLELNTLNFFFELKDLEEGENIRSFCVNRRCFFSLSPADAMKDDIPTQYFESILTPGKGFCRKCKNDSTFKNTAIDLISEDEKINKKFLKYLEQ